MAVRRIMHFDRDSILRQKSEKVYHINKEIRTLLRDMADTLRSANAIGLSAVQIGILKRVAVVRNGTRLIQLINPVIIQATGVQQGTERCLSVPGVRGNVKRPDMVLVKALNSRGKMISMKGKGPLASALCHEIDHLDGVLFIDKAIPGTLAHVEQFSLF